MQAGAALLAGQQVPHFALRTLDGSTFAYSSIWQRRNLLLVLLPDDDDDETAGAGYVRQLQAASSDLTAHGTALVIGRSPVEGVARPGVVVADRWGEVYFVTGAGTVADLPSPSELVEWLRYMQMQCPECPAR